MIARHAFVVFFRIAELKQDACTLIRSSRSDRARLQHHEAREEREGAAPRCTRMRGI